MIVSIIGAGNMGGAIARSIMAMSEVDVIYVAAPSNRHLDVLAKCGDKIKVTNSNIEAITNSDMTILAVKPYLLNSIIRDNYEALLRQSAIISIAAKVSVVELSNMFSSVSGSDNHPLIVRAMPNLAIEYGSSVNVLTKSDCVSKDVLNREIIDFISEVFSASGVVYWVDESLFDAMTSLTSCGIAFVFRFIRASTIAAIEMGIKPELAQEAFINTMRGAIEILEKSHLHVENHIDRVTTPGGITIKALNKMEENGFSVSVIEGMKAAFRCK